MAMKDIPHYHFLGIMYTLMLRVRVRQNVNAALGPVDTKRTRLDSKRQDWTILPMTRQSLPCRLKTAL